MDGSKAFIVENVSGLRLLMLPVLIVYHLLTALWAVCIYVVDFCIGKMARSYAVKWLASYVLGDDLFGEPIQSVSARPHPDMCDVLADSLDEEQESCMLQIAVEDFSKRFGGTYISLLDEGFMFDRYMADLGEFKSVHNQYYQDDKVIRMVAKIISDGQNAFLGSY